MTEHTIHSQSASTSHSAPHACQHKSEESALWHETKEAAHKGTEKSEGMWEATKDVTSDVWEKTKEVSSDAWNATKNFAGHVGDAITGQDDEDEIETYYSASETDYLDDEENEHINKENQHVNNEYMHRHSTENHH